VDAYEIGIKSSLFDRTLTVNAAAFHQQFSGFQLNTFNGTSFFVSSVPKVLSRGGEIEANWRTPVEGLRLQASYAYSKTTYQSAPFASGSAFSDITLPGQQLSLAPKNYVTGSIDFAVPATSGLTARFNLNGRYVSSYNTGSDLAPAKVQRGFALFNGRIAIGDASERWSIELFGENIFNQNYVQVAFNGTLQGGPIPAGATVYNPVTDTTTYNAYLGAPRTYGVNLRHKF
jgi:iron complex outermembrane recepter protein